MTTHILFPAILVDLSSDRLQLGDQRLEVHLVRVELIGVDLRHCFRHESLLRDVSLSLFHRPAFLSLRGGGVTRI